MGKIKRPIIFSTLYCIDPMRLSLISVFNPVLNIDTKLFIDPLLLQKSKYEKISHGSVKSFRKYFEIIIKLLLASKKVDDISWKQAYKRLAIQEVRWTCLGYGSATIHGRRIDKGIMMHLLKTAKEIVDLGITDPDMFSLLPLLEEGIGPDYISDMTTIAILTDLASFTQSICRKFSIKTVQFKIQDHIYHLPQNNTEKRRSPVILVPTDILRDLPVASNWGEVADAAAANADIRRRVSKLIGDIWKRKTRQDKMKLRAAVLASKDNFLDLLSCLKQLKAKPYDSIGDPNGVLAWKSVYESIAKKHPLFLSQKNKSDPREAIAIVDAIIVQYKRLIENKGLWKLLWDGSSPRKEKSAQLLFFAVADAYCLANNLDITPEADTGSGTVDFKFSSGYNIRILVETKLSTNKLVSGYSTQLEIYKNSQTPVYAVYLVIDIGGMRDKAKKLLEIKNSLTTSKNLSNIIFVDGKRQLSASKR